MELTIIVQQKIYELRGQRVMLDFDLAALYQVTTGNLNKAVKRNIKRFPSDFMFQLTKEEFEKMKSDLIFQNGTSSWGGTRKLPYAFTEQGLAMLSGVLRSLHRPERHQRRHPHATGTHQPDPCRNASLQATSRQAPQQDRLQINLHKESPNKIFSYLCPKQPRNSVI